MLEWFNAATARASRSKRSLNSLLETFRATMRSSRLSRALYTSPMPPAPRDARTSYGPRRVPGAKGIELQEIVPCGERGIQVRERVRAIRKLRVFRLVIIPCEGD